MEYGVKNSYIHSILIDQILDSILIDQILIDQIILIEKKKYLFSYCKKTRATYLSLKVKRRSVQWKITANS